MDKIFNLEIEEESSFKYNQSRALLDNHIDLIKKEYPNDIFIKLDGRDITDEFSISILKQLPKYILQKIYTRTGTIYKYILPDTRFTVKTKEEKTLKYCYWVRLKGENNES